ncbi:hypothetical protein CN198_26155 [Sinorhizobium meliloti]|nr:hypothetical protein CN198_26155 [Sinorhizobium meliloti]RVK66226.1 hypothetical protein CN159_19380 [Sinorhizobium meliloti]
MCGIVRRRAYDTPHPAAATFSPFRRGEGTSRRPLSPLSPQAAGESHLANKRLFCCGKSILGVLR